MAPREPAPRARGAPVHHARRRSPTRELTIEEAVAIALANQPTIQTRIGAYVAAQQRVAQALSPLLPQLSGQWNGFQNKNSVQVTGASAGQTATVSTSPSTTASVTALPAPLRLRQELGGHRRGQGQQRVRRARTSSSRRT